MDEVEGRRKRSDGERQFNLDALMPLVYDELHRLASSYMRAERPDHTLQPTALVNEVYLRLLSQYSVDFSSRSHVLGVAAQMMRRILTTHEQGRRTDKRGGDATILYLSELPELASGPQFLFDDLDEALNGLEAMDKRQAKVMELRIFGGLSVEETADFLTISPATVHRDWVSGKLWLAKELQGHRKLSGCGPKQTPAS